MEITENTDQSLLEKLCDDLLSSLRQSNKDLREGIANLENKNQQITEKKQKLFDILFASQQDEDSLSYLEELRDVQEDWAAVLKERFEFVEHKSVDCELGYKKWLQQAEKHFKGKLEIDEQTLMSFDEVEADIKKLDAEFEATEREIEELTAAGERESLKNRSTCQQYLETIVQVEAINEEIRAEKNRLTSAIKMAKRELLFVKPSKAEEQLQCEIALLELKIKQLETIN